MYIIQKNFGGGNNRSTIYQVFGEDSTQNSVNNSEVDSSPASHSQNNDEWIPETPQEKALAPQKAYERTAIHAVNPSRSVSNITTEEGINATNNSELVSNERPTKLDNTLDDNMDDFYEDESFLAARDRESRKSFIRHYGGTAALAAGGYIAYKALKKRLAKKKAEKSLQEKEGGNS